MQKQWSNQCQLSWNKSTGKAIIPNLSYSWAFLCVFLFLFVWFFFCFLFFLYVFFFVVRQVELWGSYWWSFCTFNNHKESLLLLSHLYLWGSPFWVKFLCSHIHLCGWCVLDVFVGGVHLFRTRTSESFESVRWNACVHRLDLSLCFHWKEF